jgi:ribosomal protein L3
VDLDEHLLLVSGSVPGAPNGYVLIRKAVAPKPEPQPQPEKAKKGKK